MKLRISMGGQVSIPAAIRRRWATHTVVVEDRGDSLLIRPLPVDPIGAARGSLPLPDGLTVNRIRASGRSEEARAESRRADHG